MTISALIIDDEQLARDELAYLLQAAPDVDVVAQGANGIEAVELIEEYHPDIVFLDVQMPGLDGFGVIQRVMDRHRKLQDNETWQLPQFVFATAYDQYAVRAFDVNAVDYLLKPFDSNRVEKALERVRTRLTNGANGESPIESQLDALLHLLKTNSQEQPALLSPPNSSFKRAAVFFSLTRPRFASPRSVKA